MTTLEIRGSDFWIDGKPTYEGRTWSGHRIEGLLLNSRMIQGIFDDACPETRELWAYPDTGEWDPERNVEEFCAALPAYRRHGLLAVTVGLQGGGSIYRPEVYEAYRASAFDVAGELDPAWLDRLDRVLAAADRCGMAVIVSAFYCKHARRLDGEAAIRSAVTRTAAHLAGSGRRNVIFEIGNEMQLFKETPCLLPDRIHELILLAQEVSGHAFPVTASTCGGDHLPVGRWLEVEDLHEPHGNGLTAEELAAKLRCLKETDAWRAQPKPIVVNEDSIFPENLDAAVAEGCSWGYYSQGYGSGYHDRTDWRRPREERYEDLSGYQTLPVNWGINTAEKRAFFARVADITGCLARDANSR